MMCLSKFCNRRNRCFTLKKIVIFQCTHNDTEEIQMIVGIYCLDVCYTVKKMARRTYALLGSLMEKEAGTGNV